MRRTRDRLLAAALLSASLLATACAVQPGSPAATTTGAPVPTPTVSVTTIPWPPVIALEPAWSGLRQPVLLTHAGDGSGRAFVVELPGTVRVIDGGKVLAKPFLDISARVSTGGERGLFSVAFPADYAKSGRFYVDYTNTDGDSVIARYRVFASDRNLADPASEQVIMTVKQPYANHNGGQLAFGLDGCLYIGFGDGGGSGDPQGNGQSRDTLLGKLLRIDVRGEGAYTIPKGNPFAGTARVRPEIWDLGLRNPWRFSFDTKTGDLYIADVGQNAWEEIDIESPGSGGRNYGWNLYEGTHPYPPGSAATPPITFTMPVAEYGHDMGEAVTGGFVYRGARYPSLQGVYFYGDDASGRIWALAARDGVWKTEQVAKTRLAIAGFGQDESGELYVLDLSSGDIAHITGR
jgi:glucose/arabinose dehydrogenase